MKLAGFGSLSRATVALGLVAALLGCASDKPEPLKLEPVTAQIAGRQVWYANVGGVQFPLAVTVRDGAFIVAGTDGLVLAIDAQTGVERWRGQAGGKLSAGVGSDGRMAAVVTVDNELVVLEQGVKKW